MPENENFYLPEQIDEQIDALLQAQGPARDRQLVKDLQFGLTYGVEYEIGLQEVLSKLLSDVDEQPTQQLSTSPAHFQTGSTMSQGKSRKRDRKRSIWRVWTTLAAMLAVIILVGSTMLILQGSYLSSSSSGGKLVFSSRQAGQAGVVAWSPNEKRLAAVVDNGTKIESWDALTGKNIVNYLTNDYDMITSLAWSPDGNSLAAGDLTEYYPSPAPHVYIYNAQTGQLAQTLTVQLTANATHSQLLNGSASSPELLDSKENLSGGMGNATASISWSPDGSELVATVSSSASSNEIVIWELQINAAVRKIPPENGLNHVISGSWSPNGQLFVIQECVDILCTLEKGTVYRASDWTELHNYTTALVYSRYFNVGGFAWSPDSKSLAVIDGKAQRIQLIDALSGHVGLSINVVSTNTANLLLADVQFSPDGTRLAAEIVSYPKNGEGRFTVSTGVWSANSGVKLWDTVSLNLPDSSTLTDVYQAVWSPDSEYLACTQGIVNSGGTGSQYKVLILTA